MASVAEPFGGDFHPRSTMTGPTASAERDVVPTCRLGEAAPAISVVIPTYNRLTLLKALLEALESPSPRPDSYEIIVVDDGSTDGTREYLSGIQDQIRVVLGTHGGPARARNLGWQAARGEI